MKIQPTSSRFFFANSQQSKCTEKLVIFMYDHGWNTQFTEFDIVEEGDVPLLMSLPQMRNLGFQFELYSREGLFVLCKLLAWEKWFWGKHISTHLILDLQDVGMVHEPSSFQESTSQKFLFTTRSLWVQPDCCQTRWSWRRSFGDWWLLAGWSTTSWTHQAPQGTREWTYMRWLDQRKLQFQKINFLMREKPTWNSRRARRRFFTRTTGALRRRRFSEQSEEFWKGKTIYKIKEDYVIPDDIVRSDIDRARPFRGNIDDLFHPESASSVPSGVQKKKPSSLKKEEGKPIFKWTRLEKDWGRSTCSQKTRR